LLDEKKTDFSHHSFFGCQIDLMKSLSMVQISAVIVIEFERKKKLLFICACIPCRLNPPSPCIFEVIAIFTSRFVSAKRFYLRLGVSHNRPHKFCYSFWLAADVKKHFFVKWRWNFLTFNSIFLPSLKLRAENLHRPFFKPQAQERGWLGWEVQSSILSKNVQRHPS